MADLASRPSKAMAKSLTFLTLISSHLSTPNFLYHWTRSGNWQQCRSGWNSTSLRHCVESDWICNSGQVRAEQVLESVDAAVSALQHDQQWKTSTRRSQHAPHLCCCRAGRSVRSRTSSPSSVSVKSSPSRRPKVHSGRIPRSKKILSSPAQPWPPTSTSTKEIQWRGYACIAKISSAAQGWIAPQYWAQAAQPVIWDNRGSGPRNGNFSNGPKIVSEWSNLL